MKKHPWFWTTLLLFNFLLHFSTLFFDQKNHWLDFNLQKNSLTHDYFTWARIMAEDDRWLSDFSPEAENPKALDYRIFRHPPFYAYFNALILKVASFFPNFHFDKHALILLIFLQHFLGFFCLYPVFQITHRLKKGIAPYLACFLFSFQGILLHYESLLLPASLSLCLFLFIVHFVLELSTKFSLGKALFCGLLMGMAWTANNTFPPLLCLVFIWFFLSETKVKFQKWKTFLFICIGLMLPVSLLFVRNHLINRKIQRQNPLQKNLSIMSFSRGEAYSYLNGNSLHSADGDMHDGIGNRLEDLLKKGYRNKFLDPDSLFVKKTLGTVDPRILTADPPPLHLMVKLVLEEHRQQNTLRQRFGKMLCYKLKAFFSGREVPESFPYNFHRRFNRAHHFLLRDSFIPCLLFTLGCLLFFFQARSSEKKLIFFFCFTHIMTNVFLYFSSLSRIMILPLMLCFGTAVFVEFLEYFQQKNWKGKCLLSLFLFFSLAIAWPRDVRKPFRFVTNDPLPIKDYRNYLKILKTHGKTNLAKTVLDDLLKRDRALLKKTVN
jgi:hypothetical protein